MWRNSSPVAGLIDGAIRRPVHCGAVKRAGRLYRLMPSCRRVLPILMFFAAFLAPLALWSGARVGHPPEDVTLVNTPPPDMTVAPRAKGKDAF
jgi:hypothetical protein